MYGQWYGKVEGTNTGVIVLNVDADTPTMGRLLFADVTVQPTYCSVNITIEDKTIVGQLSDFHVDPFYPSRDGVVMPTNGVMKGHFVNEFRVEGEWRTDAGTFGEFELTNLSNLDMTLNSEKNVTWDEFKAEAVAQKNDNSFTIFRGQSDSKYVLTSSLYREKRWDLVRYYENSSELCKYLSGVSGKDYNIGDMKGYTELLYLAQHHGFPTPLLDWTESPFIATFFAFHKLKKNIADGYVSIYAFDWSKWSTPLKLPSDRGFFNITQPVVQVLDLISAKGNSRAIAQQSVVTFSNIHNVESYVDFMSKKSPCLKKYNIAASERNTVLKELGYMGITAATVYPGIDGTCQMLKEKMF